ncbi:MAG: cytochrome (ubi)quinol oxidase subunit III [Bacilli bacterium]
MAAIVEHAHAGVPGRDPRPLEYTVKDDSLKIFGFWIFLATDMILFATLFATFVVLRTHVATGPSGRQLFDVQGFIEETFILLTSSFTGGMSTFFMRRGSVRGTVGWLLVTAGLGVSFVTLEITEFLHYVSIGATMQTSAFLSAFFTLVGTHGAHVSLGIVWMLAIVLQLLRFGITPATARRVFIVNLYWHFLDVVWVFIFTVVYLTGVMR